MAGSTPRRRTERAVALRGGTALDEFTRGRRCSYPGCRAVLSRYNPDDGCASHGGWREAEIRGRRRKRPA